jgi:hypothetical protein
MKFSTVISMTLVAITSLSLFACGGGGGGGGPSSATLTADKMSAVTPVLINGTTTITFNFGASVPDGTAVTYTASPSSAVLSNKTNIASGIATVDLTSPIQSDVSVTASIAGVTGSKTVQFIPQPDRAVVHVATTKTITDLSILTFGLRNNLGTNCPYTSFTAAPDYTGYTASNSMFFVPGNDVYQWQILTFGFNVTPSKNLLELTFTPASAAGVPFFEVFQYPNNPQDLSFNKYMKVTSDPATDTQTTTNLVVTDFVITTDYYLGATLLATK